MDLVWIDQTLFFNYLLSTLMPNHLFLLFCKCRSEIIISFKLITREFVLKFQLSFLPPLFPSAIFLPTSLVFWLYMLNFASDFILELPVFNEILYRFVLFEDTAVGKCELSLLQFFVKGICGTELLLINAFASTTAMNYSHYNI